MIVKEDKGGFVVYANNGQKLSMRYRSLKEAKEQLKRLAKTDVKHHSAYGEAHGTI